MQKAIPNSQCRKTASNKERFYEGRKPGKKTAARMHWEKRPTCESAACRRWTQNESFSADKFSNKTTFCRQHVRAVKEESDCNLCPG
jgi:hypothetical protein